ncbi:MAG TPA: antibiotic biosynthesis monooxygenase [Pseudonocardia sp.]
MVTAGYLIRVEAEPDKVAEVEAMLKSAMDHVRKEGLAVVWFALRLGPTTFGVFDAFADDADRQAHMEANGQALRAALFAGAPSVEQVDIIAALVPGG